MKKLGEIKERERKAYIVEQCAYKILEIVLKIYMKNEKKMEVRMFR